jgi:hypothetical protein
MTSPDCDAIRKRLMRHGILVCVDFGLWQRSKPSVSRQLFLEDINPIFVPYLNELQESEEFEACEAVLLLHHCSPHMSDGLVALPISVRVRIITFTTDTTQIFQMLDVILFGVLKRHATGLKSLAEEQ